MMLESQKATQIERKTEDSLSVSRKYIYRHHAEPRLQFYDPDNETFTDPIDIRRHNETNSDEFQHYL